MVSENKTNESKTLRTAIVYDFDGTLARGNIQEHTFLPDMGIPKEKFRAEQGLELPVEMRLLVVAVGEGEIGAALRMTDRE